MNFDGTQFKGIAGTSPQTKAPGPYLNAGANSAWCSSNMPGLEPGDRRCKSCRADHFTKSSAGGFRVLTIHRLPQHIRVMRLGITFLLGLVLATIIARADEMLPTLKVGNVTYTNVTVTSVTAKNIAFTYAQGMASVKLKDLDPEMQKHFHYDASKDIAEAKQKAALAAALASIGPDNKVPDSADPKLVMEAAVARVKAIVNQSVMAIPFSPDMQNVGSGNDWFHPGAIKPDFDTVDVRKTQDFSNYQKFTYVTSKLNPGVVFLTRDIEFNSMTKYFYTDRSVPKKKLSEKEMLEINRLYRIIGQCEKRLK